MLRVVFEQTARFRCACGNLSIRREDRRGHHGQHHTQGEQNAEYSFLHVVFPSCSCGSGLPVPPFFRFSLILNRMHSAVIAAAAAKDTTATST